ncbi:asparagine synthase (glutamine-hydrolyzing) [Nonomuraea sp. KM88]|uniref:asparagine synthase (glutamine-hydrolyzing) n=1 Tax=Nonomuraea sp. KM88 TaxID=3457427 RepID=UPI003FCE9995
MCGIVGWVDWQRDLRDHRDVLAAMTETLACRGPDGSGVWTARHVGFGHRRLAVLDVAGGAQPAVAEAVAMTYNGEVYNFRELRDELRAKGHRFTTTCDTEVVLRAYLEWGEDFAGRLSGIYALAIWDGRTEELVLVRDRLGVKPLYFTGTPHGVIFGSEPKALLANPGFAPVIDADGLAELFAAASAPTPGRSPLRGLSEVRPGTLVRVSRRGTRHRTYWSLTARPHEDGDEATVRRVRELLGSAVDEQLVSDVPLCSLLSGGLDSSAVTALGARSYRGGAYGDKLSSYAVDFHDSGKHFQETTLHHSLDAPYARAVASHVGTSHTEVLLDVPDLLAWSDATTRARDLPGLGDADISLHLLFRRVARDCTVALSGESADEVFGGYPWFAREAAEPTGFFPWYRAAPLGLAGLLGAEAAAWCRPGAYLAESYAQAMREVPRLGGESSAERRLREVGHLYLTRFLPLLLTRMDRMSMAAGLEVRVPFCDHRLVDYVWNVPWRLKNAGGIEKGLLRRAVADLLPAEVLNRPKSAYPAMQNPAYVASLRARVRDAVADPAGPLKDLLDAGAVRALLDPGGPQPATTLGSVRALGFLVQFDHWFRTYGVAFA